MILSEAAKAILNILTVLAWGIGTLIIILVIYKGNKMKKEMGVSFKTYLVLVGIVEVFYIIGAAIILSAMGLNVMQHLARLELWQFSKAVGTFDVSTVKIIGTVGWIGFVINRSVSFLSPGYLIIYGGKRLPKYVYYSAWTEIGLESLVTILIAASLVAG